MSASSSSDLHIKRTSFERIYNAALAQDEAMLKNLLTFFCVDEWESGSFGASAVFYLAQQGHQSAVEFLIKHGANINHAVRGAAAGHHKHLVASLLRQGASINEAVCGFAQGNDEGAVDELLKLGASIHYAAMGFAFAGKFDRVRSYLKTHLCTRFVIQGTMLGGKDTSAPVDFKADPSLMVYYAAARGNFARAQDLLDEHRVDVSWLSAGVALGGHFIQSEVLLADGADVTIAASAAAEAGHSTHAEALLLKGASVESVGYSGAKGGHLRIVYKLLARGIAGDCILLGLIKGGQQLAAEKLFKQGVSLDLAINSLTGDERDLLIYFCLVAWAHGNEEAYKKLEEILQQSIEEIKSVIEMAFKFPQPLIMQKVLSIARQNGDELLSKRVLSLFPSNEAGIAGSLLGAAILNSSNDAYEYLISNGYLTRLTKELDGSTPMHLAAQSNNVMVLESLCAQYPMMMFQQNENGETPLHIAAKYSSWDALQTLIDRGVSLYTRNRFGKTALDEILNISEEEIKKPVLQRHISAPSMRPLIDSVPQKIPFFEGLNIRKKEFLKKLDDEIRRLNPRRSSPSVTKRIEALELLRIEIDKQSNNKTPLILIILNWKENAGGYDYQIVCKRGNYAGAKPSETEKLIMASFSDHLMRAQYLEAIEFRKQQIEPAIPAINLQKSPAKLVGSSLESSSQSRLDDSGRPIRSAPLSPTPSPISSEDTAELPVASTSGSRTTNNKNVSRQLFGFLKKPSSTTAKPGQEQPEIKGSAVIPTKKQ